MRLLPAEQRSYAYGGDHIIAGLHEHSGYRWFSRFDLRDPQRLASGDNLKGLLVNEVDRPTVP